ncbi:hypothetical protein D3C76_701280 [compost metagenome]
MRFDAAAAEGVAGNRHLGDAVLVQVADIADIVIEVHIQVQARAGGFLFDLPARLERVVFGGAPVQRGLEYHLVHFLLAFRVAGLAIAAAQYQQAFTVAVTKVHALDRRLHTQYLELLDRDGGQGLEVFLLAGGQQQQAAHGHRSADPAVLGRHVDPGPSSAARWGAMKRLDCCYLSHFGTFRCARHFGLTGRSVNITGFFIAGVQAVWRSSINRGNAGSATAKPSSAWVPSWRRMAAC